MMMSVRSDLRSHMNISVSVTISITISIDISKLDCWQNSHSKGITGQTAKSVQRCTVQACKDGGR